MEERDFEDFVRKVRDRTAIDLSLYKEQQMKRRLTTLRQKHGYASFAAYFEALCTAPALLAEFMDRMTINVSEFWRNPGRWLQLEQKLLPVLLRNSEGLKCWSAACSTGEEPYTLAMILSELGALSRCTLDATDLDEGVLAKAREGIYPERSIREVPAAYLQKYFHRHELAYRIDDSLKNPIRYAKMNLLADSFDRNYDLIICRNVMIYFTDEAKRQLYTRFAQALKPGGILFVGSTEQIFSPEKYGLQTVDTFFYRKMV